MTTRLMYKSKSKWQLNTSTKPVNHVKSAIFMKKLVAMSISHIIYLRGLMPEHAFEDREMDGVPVKIITEKTKFGPATQIVEWLKGAFEAFDYKYLEKLEFIFFIDSTSKILESYAFSFKYGNGQITMNCERGKEDEKPLEIRMDEIRLNTVQLLRHTSVLVQNMTEIKENLSMRVRLYYYDDVTPDDYEPPGFERAPDSEYVFDHPSIKLRHGTVDTGFHSLKVNSRICTDRFKHQKGNDEEFAESDLPNISNRGEHESETMDCIPSSQSQHRSASGITLQQRLSYSTNRKGTAMDLEVEDMDDGNSLVKMGSGVEESEEAMGMRETPTDVQHAGVCCVCGVNEDEGLLVFCEMCRQWMHAICYRLSDDKMIPKSFCCIFCHKANPNIECHDKTLIPLSPEHRKMICLYRRALVFCLSAWRVDKKILSSELSISEEMADKLLTYMGIDKVFFARKRSKGTYLHINTFVLKNEIVPKYIVEGRVDFPVQEDEVGIFINDQDTTEDTSGAEQSKKRKLNHTSISKIQLQPRAFKLT